MEDVIHLRKGVLAVDVSPLGGAVLSAEWNSIPVMAPTPSPGLASQMFGAEACFPLVPFGNRIENNCFRFEGVEHTLLPNTADPLVLHGDGWLHRWDVLEQAEDRVVFRYCHERRQASPFAYDATETITIDGNTLTLSLAVTNKASRTLPYGLGFHPYFPRTPATRLFANVSHCWSERENHLPGVASPLPPELSFSIGAPLPERWLNNAYQGWDGKALIEWAETRVGLSLDTGEGFTHFFLYSPSENSGFFCFEPMSHMPNAHARPSCGNLVQLDPGSNMRCEMRLTWRKL